MLRLVAAAAALSAAVVVAQPTVVPRCKLGPVDISCIAMGTLHLHEVGDAATALQTIQAAAALGLTTWDTSDVYNSMPELLGQAVQLQPGLRSQLQIIGKMDITSAWNGFGFDSGSSYDTSAAHLNAVLQRYLTAFNTTYIDVVLLHRQDYLTNFTELAGVVNGWLQAGTVKAFGTSNYDKDTFLAMSKAMPLVANEIELSVLRPQPFYDGTVSLHYGLGSTVLSWGPLGGDPYGGQNRLFAVGSLDGTPRNSRIKAGLGTVAAALNTTSDVAAIAWLLKHPAGVVPIIGTMQPARMAAQSLGAVAAAANMTRAQWYHIADAAGVPIY